MLRRRFAPPCRHAVALLFFLAEFIFIIFFALSRHCLFLSERQRYALIRLLPPLLRFTLTILLR